LKNAGSPKSSATYPFYQSFSSRTPYLCPIENDTSRIMHPRLWDPSSASRFFLYQH
jgi:hypothetical protein